jgi:hypothetical protein
MFALRCRSTSPDAAFAAQAIALDVRRRHNQNFGERERIAGLSSNAKHD